MLIHEFNRSMNTKRVIEPLQRREERTKTVLQCKASEKYNSKLSKNEPSLRTRDLASREPAKGSSPIIGTDRIAGVSPGNLWRWDKVEEYLRREKLSGVRETVHETSPTHAQSTSQKTSPNRQAMPEEPKEDWESFNLDWHRWLPEVVSSSARALSGTLHPLS
jgi:hypothetical protein